MKILGALGVLISDEVERISGAPGDDVERVSGAPSMLLSHEVVKILGALGVLFLKFCFKKYERISRLLVFYS